jgi:hypothetical protein
MILRNFIRTCTELFYNCNIILQHPVARPLLTNVTNAQSLVTLYIALVILKLQDVSEAGSGLVLRVGSIQLEHVRGSMSLLTPFLFRLK